MGLAIPAGATAATVSHGPAAGVIASGQVLAHGRPVAGARVQLWAWDPGRALMRLHPGQRADARVVGSALTSPDGRYAVRVAAPATLAAQAEPDGTVNLTLVAQSRQGVSTWSFARQLAPAAHGRRLDSATTGGTAGAATPAATTLRLAGQPATPAPVPCGWIYLKGLGTRWVSVGVTYSKVSGVSQHFTYRAGQSSSLGVSDSPSGRAGSFSEAGTNSMSSSTSESYPTFRDVRGERYRTKFVEREYGYTCSHGIITYQTRTTGYAGGAAYGRWPAPPAHKCVTQDRRTRFTKDTTAAYNWSVGFTIPSVGVGLSAQTGYDHSAEVSYYFRVKRALCGTNDYPGGTPKLIVAGNPK